MTQILPTLEGKDLDKAIAERIVAVVRPLIHATDVIKIDDTSIIFRFYDPMLGEREMRAYAHEGSAVLTSFADQHPSVAYIHKAADERNFKAFEKLATSYITNPFKHYEGPMLEKWRYIEGLLGEFVKSYGVEVLTSKVLQVPFMDEATRIKLLSYLTLEGEIRAARERDAKIELARQYVPPVVEPAPTAHLDEIAREQGDTPATVLTEADIPTEAEEAAQ